jgi:hypothetical protein
MVRPDVTLYGEFLPEEAYQNPDFNMFATLDYYPPEFLYTTVSAGMPVRMSLYHSTGILSQCVPYGFRKENTIICQNNDIILTNTDSYLIQGHTDYEKILADIASVQEIPMQALLPQCEEEKLSLLSALMQGKETQSVWISDSNSPASAEAGILCGSFYDDFVYENYTALPESPALEAVREAYAGLLDTYHAETANPYQTIMLLQALRDQICANVTYTLAPGKTPSNTDHTAYFLLDNRKGY